MTKRKDLHMNAGVYIGTSKDAVAEVRDAIMAILTSGACERVQRVALESLASLAAPPSSVSLSNCTIGMGEEPRKTKP